MLTPTEAARLAVSATAAPDPELLGAGMEGVVLALDDTRVAKVWHAGDPAVLERLHGLHDALAGLGLPFATPRTREVHEVEGRLVTVEDRLVGTDLRTLVAQGRLTSSAARDHVVEVLAALADALGPRLDEVDSGARAVVHGDLVPTNVLLDDTGAVSAVLDWGFLTTEGDPAFDAAVAAAVFEMYAEDAAAVEQDLLDRVEQRLGHPREALLVHRAAYSLLTATAYDPLGRDGHFAWCVAALHRPDVLAAVLG